MEFLFLGFFTGLSLILALGAQNIFVIEQGLKKQYVFIVCLICSISDLILIFLGIFLFEYFNDVFTKQIELLFNILLFIFLIYFISTKIRSNYSNVNFEIKTETYKLKNIFLKTLAFTYLNPHVYSDTVFFLGNLSKNFELADKYFFGVGASISSFLFFFILGYLSKFSSNYLKNPQIWKIINNFIILFMGGIALFVLREIINYY
jgi:L-lysine exporter family protein LysE/ArgO